MATGDQYRIKAAEFHAQAQSMASPKLRAGFANLAKAYLRLAEQADRRWRKASSRQVALSLRLRSR
jgi:hypothetical protein